MLKSIRILAGLGFAAGLGACATWDGAPDDGSYYEAYGYPQNYEGPGYYGPGYYAPGYYGNYWYGGGYYTPGYSGGYAAYPYYPGTHVVIVHRDPPPPEPDHDREPIRKRPHDPVNPQPQRYEPAAPPHPLNDRIRGRGPDRPLPLSSEPYRDGARLQGAPRAPAPVRAQPTPVRTFTPPSRPPPSVRARPQSAPARGIGHPGGPRSQQQ